MKQKTLQPIQQEEKKNYKSIMKNYILINLINPDEMGTFRHIRPNKTKY